MSGASLALDELTDFQQLARPEDRAPDALQPPDRALRLPVSAEARVRWQRQLNAMPVLTHMGAELDLSDPAVVRLALLRSNESHRGGLGTTALNGAVIAGMVDCGIATAGILQFRGRTCGTVHLSIDFMKPVRIPNPVLECRVLRRTDSLAFVEALLCGPGGVVYAQASGIVSLARLTRQVEPVIGHENWTEVCNERNEAAAGA